MFPNQHTRDLHHKADTMVKLLYAIPDAAQQLSISARVMERLVASGEVESVKVGRRRLVPHEALEAYIARAKRAS